MTVVSNFTEDAYTVLIRWRDSVDRTLRDALMGLPGERDVRWVVSGSQIAGRYEHAETWRCEVDGVPVTQIEVHVCQDRVICRAAVRATTDKGMFAPSMIRVDQYPNQSVHNPPRFTAVSLEWRAKLGDYLGLWRDAVREQLSAAAAAGAFEA